MKRVRLGILGTGTVIRTCHLPAALANPRAEVAAIGNLRADSLRKLAGEFGIQKFSTDFDAMAHDPDIDAVVIGLPNFLHAPVAVKMLQAGKHVLCEKPMAMSVAEAKAMVDAADASGRKLMIAHVWRSSPEVQWLRDVIAKGVLGCIETVKAHAIVAGRGPDADSWFVDPATAGGGAFADAGSHSIDTISFLFGDRIHPTKVARIGNRFRQLAVEDTATVWIEYDDGMVAQIEAGWHHPHTSNPHGAVEVFGTLGSARTLPPQCKLQTGAAANELAPPEPSEHPDADLSIYAVQMDHFLDVVLDGRRATCDARQGLRNMIVLEAAYRSAAIGASVFIGTTCETESRFKQ